MPERSIGGLLPRRSEGASGSLESSVPNSPPVAGGDGSGLASSNNPLPPRAPGLTGRSGPNATRRDAVAKALEAFGLRKATSKLYCAALTMGPALPLEVILSAKVPRATGYRGLERLRRLDLVVPVGRRPLRIEAVPLSRLLDRSAIALLDEVALHREMREVAAESLTATATVPARAPVLVGPADVARVLRESMSLARKELHLVPVLRGLPSEARTAIREGVEQALHRGTKVRVLVPNEKTYLRALPGLAQPRSPGTHFERRLSEPPFFHLYVIDATRAVRFFVRSTPSDRPSGILGVVSERPSFVQSQQERFRSLWSEATAAESIDEADEDRSSSAPDRDVPGEPSPDDPTPPLRLRNRKIA